MIDMVAYDTSANLLSLSRPLLDGAGATVAVATTTYHYGEVPGALAGDVTSVVDPTVRRWSYTYDAYGNQSSITDPLGHRASATFDLAGRQISATSPRGNDAGADPLDFTSSLLLRPRQPAHDQRRSAGRRGRAQLRRQPSPVGDDRPAGQDHHLHQRPGRQLTGSAGPTPPTLAYAYFADGSLASYRDGAWATTS